MLDRSFKCAGRLQLTAVRAYAICLQLKSSTGQTQSLEEFMALLCAEQGLGRMPVQVAYVDPYQPSTDCHIALQRACDAVGLVSGALKSQCATRNAKPWLPVYADPANYKLGVSASTITIRPNKYVH